MTAAAAGLPTYRPMPSRLYRGIGQILIVQQVIRLLVLVALLALLLFDDVGMLSVDPVLIWRRVRI